MRGLRLPGAGNRVVQEVFAGRSWQQEPRLVGPIMEAFAAMREVHKRIDLLRTAYDFALDPEDQQTRTQLLTQLERQQWSGDNLNEFLTGLASYAQKLTAIIRQRFEVA